MIRAHHLEIVIGALRNSAREDAAGILEWPQNALLKKVKRGKGNNIF